ncbi:hypothetical protein BGZ98_003651 [Dissophora globulifera]|nr:hypothetical protein BGZ98_003651 [Dissophora globulifera]
MKMLKVGRGGLARLGIESFAEFLGSAMYMYLAIGGADAISLGATIPGEAYLGQAFAFGFSLIATSWAFFRISGGMFNPAVAFSGWITGHLGFIKFASYFLCQLLGSMLGVALTRGTTPSIEHIGQVNEVVNGESIARAFFLEFFLTSIICFTYHMVVYEKNRSTYMMAIPYGISVFACYLFAYRYTFAALNPARAFATALAAEYFPRTHWVFWFGPLSGAIFGAAMHILFRFLDFDQYTAGYDAENEDQYQRAQAAAAKGGYVLNADRTTGTPAGRTVA